MGAPDQAELDGAALRVWTRVLDLRAVAIVVITATSVVVPTMHGHRLATFLALTFGFLPYNLLLQWRIRRTHRLEPLMPVADVVATALYGLLAPAAWPAVIAAVAAEVALAVVMFGRRTAVLAAVLATAALTVAAARVDSGGPVGVSGAIAAMALIIVTVGYAHARERASTSRYAELVDGIQGIVWEYDVRVGGLTLLSQQVESILGWSREEAMSLRTWRDRTITDRFPDSSGLVDLAVAGRASNAEFQVRHADGHPVWLRARTTVQRDANGAPRSVRGILFDTTAEHETALELHQFADIVGKMQLGLTVWRLTDPDDDRSIVLTRHNQAANEVSPLDGREGDRFVDIWPNDYGNEFVGYLTRAIRTGQHDAIRDIPYHRPDGSDGYLSIRLIPLPGDSVALASEDVTDRHDIEAALRHQALHDSLTGLPNRALLQDRLASSLSAARRTGRPLALLVMDLDQFKEVNDTLGHPMGDNLLVEVGSRLANVLRDCDTVARLGGDEFAVLLTTDASAAGAQRVAERIRDELGKPFDLGGVSVQAASSIGIVLSPEHGDDAETLTQRADIAMYNAKRAARGWAFYSAEDDRTSVRRLGFLSELRQALERDELVMHYQPQIDLATGTVVGVEALVRWQHPDHGLLLPAEFIQLAEVSGIIQPLTRWVVRTAVAQAAELLQAGHQLVVGANVSGRNLYDPDLAEGIAADLRDFAVPPELLLLELTESELVDDPSQVMTVLTLVSGMGVRVAIDDFGTGWSSLANLTRLPVHQIKIDRSFVARMIDGGDDAVIVRSIIDLGHNLGLAVVAEGMENDPTMQALTELGCDQGQGYLVSKPMPREQLLAWLMARADESLTSS